VQQNSIEALHQNRNFLKQITGLSSLASINCDSFPRSARSWRADALKTPKKPLYFGSLGFFKIVDVDTTEKLVTSACCDGQQAHAYLQPFSRKAGQQR